jgi:structural maintenance of chromosome 4
MEKKMSELNELREKKKSKENKLEFMENEMMRLQNDLEETREGFRKFELEDTQLIEEMKIVNVKRKKLITNSKLEKERGSKFEKIPEVNEMKIKECEELLTKHQTQIDKEQKHYEEAIQKLKTETREFQEQKEGLETELIKYTKDENESLSLLNIAASELEVLTGKEEKEKIKLELLEVRLKQATDDQKEKNKTLQVKEKRTIELEKSLIKLESKFKTETGNYEEVKTKARHTRSTFEETKNAQLSKTGLSKVYDAIMKQSRTGAIDGIIGRLGDLGIIDKKYDVAVSTAGSNSFDTILVNDVHTAQSCINFLKSKNIGRANFLALNKLEKYTNKVSSHITAPENVSRIIDLIQVKNEKHNLAFYHYLKDTLVAEDLDQANRITGGKVSYRVITLNGELIEQSGAMSGGGSRTINGKMRFEFQDDVSSFFCRYDEKSLKTLENKLQKEELEVSRLSEQNQHHEQEIYKMKREYDALINSVKKIKLEINKVKQQTEILEEQIEPQRLLLERVKPDVIKVKEIRGKVERLTTHYDEVMERSRDIKEAVKKLNFKIKEVGSNKVKSARNKLENIKTQHGKVRKEITHLKVGIQSAIRDLQKSKNKSDSYDIEIKESEAKMQEMKQQREEFESKGKELILSLEELRSAENKGKERIQNGKDLIKTLEDEENNFQSDQIEIEQENEKFRSSLKELSRNMKHWRREKEQLKLQIIPGEEEHELVDYSSTEEDKHNLEKLDIESWQYKLSTMEEELGRKQPQLSAIDEYRHKESIYLARANELDDITKKKDIQRQNHEQLRRKRLSEFMEGYGIITGKLKETYQLITLGGDAELELVDSLDPFTEGIIFSVRPPKKSWKNISNLSGGEKTLSSLALVFALHHYKPTPFYIMDEIDAALDFRNVSIVGRHIKEKTRNAQFIIVSLRSNMFELADRLIGIYKTYNCSKSVGIDPDKVEQKPSTSQQETVPNIDIQKSIRHSI